MDQRNSNELLKFWFKGLSLLLVMLPGMARSQIYYFDNYSVSEGLAQSKVFTIIQDRQDYLWLGTEGGISRFNGAYFENFTSEDSLALNGVRTLYEDSEGVLWIGHTGGGISLLRGNHFQQLDLPGIQISTDITSINQDSRGGIWIATAGEGVLRIQNPADPHETYDVEQYSGDRLSDRVFDLVKGNDSSMYFVTDIGVQKIRQGSEAFEKVFYEGMGYFQVTSFLEDDLGNLWFGTYNDGLYKYNLEIGELEFFNTKNGMAHNFVSTISEDTEGNIWVGTWGGGLTRIRDDVLKIFHSGNGLQDDKVWCILEDVEGNILVGTNENGLSIFKGEQFVAFTEGNGLVNNQVWAVLEDQAGRYWFGTNGGISIYDPQISGDRSYRHLTEDDYPIGNQIRFLKEDQEGHIWIGTYGSGTFEYDPARDRFNYSFRINAYNQQLIVTAMEIDGTNKLWVGTTDGLIYYDINLGKVQFLTQVHGLAGTDISALFADSKGVVWVGSKGKGITTITGDTASRLDLETGFTPTCFAETGDGRIWMGTEGQGIFALEGGKVVKQLSRQNGLLANLITLVNVDEQDNIYIGTNQGLNKYVSAEDKIYTYMEKDGFIGIETKKNASFRDKKGILWFGTVGGAVMHDPVKARVSFIDPLTHITRMRVNLEEREMDAGLKLRYTENSIIFDYYSICLSNPDAVRYQYQLEGADPDWLPVTDQTTATYPALRPGKYLFQVRASNSHGDWNELPVSYAFQIHSPFYATWWFIMICILAGALGIFLYIKIRERQLRRENRILEEKVKERTAVVVSQKEELAQKNRDITDSIQYAKRIQYAILPPEIPFENTFILFKPKDIVSGDFYWLLEKDGIEFLAAVDCTGHGVPGAFMSIIGHNMLNKIVKEYSLTTPAEILKRLDREVTRTLHQQEETVTIMDGMEMTLISYRRDKKLIEFAGAINPVYLIREGELQEIKGSRYAIGRSKIPEEKEFTNHEISIRESDVIYMFSDGYADQFGGPKGKKFKPGPMKDLLKKIHPQSMEAQRHILNKTIESWRGNIKQVDDILVIGRRF